jgi:signal transduction histidine kinase
VLLAAGWSLAVLVIAGFALTTFFSNAAQDRFDRSLAEQADNLLSVSTVSATDEVVVPPMSDPKTARGFSGRYWSITEPGPDGQLVELDRSASLGDAAPLAPPPGGMSALLATPGRAVFYDGGIGPVSRPLRVAAMLASLPSHQGPLIFMAAEDRSDLDRDQRRFAVTTAATLMLLGVGLILAVLIQVKVGLRPLFALRREVAAVRKGSADRLVRTYPSELEALAQELNALVAHNQEVVERQRTHVGNLAHALKTPLSVMLTEADQAVSPTASGAKAAAKRLPRVVREQAESMRSQVDHHLRRARAAARAQTNRERTPVGPVIDELSRTLERIFRDKGIEIETVVGDGICFQGERQDLLELAGNVMENACLWAKKRVRVSAAAAGGRLVLKVEDDGPGLPAERRAEVLRRGARLDESAPGSGLGLSIVDDLARAYGGAVILGDATLGGLLVTLDLPSAET